VKSNSLCVVVLDGSPSGLSFYVPFGLLCLVFVQKQRNFTDREMYLIVYIIVVSVSFKIQTWLSRHCDE
jgi:hypothetical protein